MPGARGLSGGSGVALRVCANYWSLVFWSSGSPETSNLRGKPEEEEIVRTEASASGPVCRFKPFGCDQLEIGYKVARAGLTRRTPELCRRLVGSRDVLAIWLGLVCSGCGDGFVNCVLRRWRAGRQNHISHAPFHEERIVSKTTTKMFDVLT